MQNKTKFHQGTKVKEFIAKNIVFMVKILRAEYAIITDEHKAVPKNKADKGRILPTTKSVPGHNNRALSVIVISIPKTVTKKI